MALLRFPVEVWELILDELDDSEDILNTFRAYPELVAEGVLKKKRHLWLFEQVIPHLIRWIKDKGLLSCRQVNRQWSRGVDNFLENHPSKRAFDPTVQITGQLRIPKASQAHYELRDYWRGLKEFTSPEKFKEFLRNMGQLPLTRNPFLGRSIYIGDGSFEGFKKDAIVYWKQALEFLDKFGSHVWFLSVGRHTLDSKTFSPLMIEILNRVPNLKRLEIYYHDDGKESTGLDAWAGTPEYRELLPPIPQLETLDLFDESYPSQSIFHGLVVRYANQIKRLDIHHHIWKEEYSSIFSKLTELCYFFPLIAKDSPTITILHTLEAPELRNLKISLPYKITKDAFGGRNIICWLKRFTQLNSFELAGENAGTVEMLSRPTTPELDKIVSVRSLQIQGHHSQTLNYSFLKCFPMLEYLHVRSWDGFGTIPNFREMLPRLKEHRVDGAKESLSGPRQHWRDMERGLQAGPPGLYQHDVLEILSLL